MDSDQISFSLKSKIAPKARFGAHLDSAEQERRKLLADDIRCLIADRETTVEALATRLGHGNKLRLIAFRNRLQKNPYAFSEADFRAMAGALRVSGADIHAAMHEEAEKLRSKDVAAEDLQRVPHGPVQWKSILDARPSRKHARPDASRLNQKEDPEFFTQVKSLMALKGVRQEDMALVLGIPEASFSGMLNGHIGMKFSLLRTLLVQLGVPPDSKDFRQDTLQSVLLMQSRQPEATMAAEQVSEENIRTKVALMLQNLQPEVQGEMDWSRTLMQRFSRHAPTMRLRPNALYLKEGPEFFEALELLIHAQHRTHKQIAAQWAMPETTLNAQLSGQSGLPFDGMDRLLGLLDVGEAPDRRSLLMEKACLVSPAFAKKRANADNIWFKTIKEIIRHSPDLAPSMAAQMGITPSVFKKTFHSARPPSLRQWALSAGIVPRSENLAQDTFDQFQQRIEQLAPQEGASPDAEKFLEKYHLPEKISKNRDPKLFAAVNKIVNGAQVSQSYMARKLKVESSTLHRWLTAKRNFPQKQLVELAGILEIRAKPVYLRSALLHHAELLEQGAEKPAGLTEADKLHEADRHLFWNTLRLCLQDVRDAKGLGNGGMQKLAGKGSMSGFLREQKSSIGYESLANAARNLEYDSVQAMLQTSPHWKDQWDVSEHSHIWARNYKYDKANNFIR